MIFDIETEGGTSKNRFNNIPRIVGLTGLPTGWNGLVSSYWGGPSLTTACRSGFSANFCWSFLIFKIILLFFSWSFWCKCLVHVSCSNIVFFFDFGSFSRNKALLSLKIDPNYEFPKFSYKTVFAKTCSSFPTARTIKIDLQKVHQLRKAGSDHLRIL